jgi:hypothetical protein
MMLRSVPNTGILSDRWRVLLREAPDDVLLGQLGMLCGWLIDSGSNGDFSLDELEAEVVTIATLRGLPYTTFDEFRAKNC